MFLICYSVLTLNKQRVKNMNTIINKTFSSGEDKVSFHSDFTITTFFEGEKDTIESSQDFFDFVTSVIKNYSSVVRNISYNVVDNWQEINESYEMFEYMSENQKVLFDLVLCDYSYSYDLPTLTNYCLENACLFEGSASDYAYEFIEDCYDIRSMGTLANYIDYESFARDLVCGGDIIELGYNLFWTNPQDIY